jgi:hypothetical protein
MIENTVLRRVEALTRPACWRRADFGSFRIRRTDRFAKILVCVINPAGANQWLARGKGEIIPVQKDARVLDGSGAPPFGADVLVTGNHIADIAELA